MKSKRFGSQRQSNTIIEGLKTRIGDLTQRMNSQEHYSRRNNIRIMASMNLPNGETWKQTATQVLTLLQDKLQLPHMKIERAHRGGLVGQSFPQAVVACDGHF